LTKTGSSTQVLSGSSNYTGPTQVSAGVLEISGSLSATTSVNITSGSLLLSGSTTGGGASDRISNSAGVTLAGGTLGVADGFSNGLDEKVGALTLSANSFLDFGTSTGAIRLTFDYGNTSFSGYTTGKTLTIGHWDGSLAGGGQDQLLLSGLSTAPSVDFLNAITFSNGYGTGAAAIDFGSGNYEIVPIPEPSSTALIGSLGLVGLVTLRHWTRRSRHRATRSLASNF
jgi:autotransporter-associated beta strand protein